jgi:hypothetical protein
MNCEEFRESADALALGALAPEEARQARNHLAACAACAADYEAASAVVERLPLSVPLVRTPAGMRAGVFAAIGVSPDAAARSEPAATARPGQPPVALPQRAPRTSRKRLFGARLVLPAIAAAVAVVAIAGMALWVSDLQGRIHKLEQQQAHNPAPPVASPAYESQAQHDAILLLSSPNTVSSRLWARPGNPSADGSIIWNPAKQRCVVLASKLQPLDPDHEYRILLSAGENHWDGGTLTADENGAAEADFSTDRWQLGVGYTVSIVDRPRAQGGTSQPVLEGTVQAPTQ